MERFREYPHNNFQQFFRNQDSEHNDVLHALAKHLERWEEVAKQLKGNFHPDPNLINGGEGSILGKSFSLHYTPVVIDDVCYGLIRISGINPVSNKSVEIDSYLINGTRRILSPSTIAEFSGESPSVIEYAAICEVLNSVLASRLE